MFRAKFNPKLFLLFMPILLAVATANIRVASATPPESDIATPSAIRPSSDRSDFAIPTFPGDLDDDKPLIEQLDLADPSTHQQTPSTVGAFSIEFAEYSSDGTELSVYNGSSNSGDPLGIYVWSGGTYLLDVERSSGITTNSCTLPLELVPLVPPGALESGDVLIESDSVRELGAPYLISPSHGSTGGSACDSIRPDGTNALILIRADIEGITLTPTNESQSEYGQNWFDYEGISHDFFPTNSGSRFVFISPFELLDTRYTYPGTELNIVYAIPSSDGVDLFGGDGQQRLANDGMAIYWPVGEAAITSGDKDYSFDDLNIQGTDYCRGGIAVRFNDGDYGKVARVPAYLSTSGVCQIIKGDPVNNPDRITVNSAFGFYDENTWEADFTSNDSCNNSDPDICRTFNLLNFFYGDPMQASGLFAQFSWTNPGRIQVYHNSQTVFLEQITEPAQVQLIKDLLPTTINLPETSGVSRDDDTIEIWTRTSGSNNCTDESPFPRSMLVIAHDRDAEGILDSDTDHINTKGLVFNRGGSTGSFNYSAGWNDSSNGTRCMTVEPIEDNAVFAYYDNLRQAGGSSTQIDDADGESFIAYASRSCDTDCVGNSNNANNGNTDGDAAAAQAALVTCETRLNNPLTWLACPLLNIADEVILQLDTQLDNLLQIDQDDYGARANDTRSGTYKDSWRVIANIATIGVVFTAIFMVLSTALDIGFFSNYTVKKYMPRIVIAVIGIQLSWVLGTLFIEVVNEIGAAVEAIVYYPFPNARDLTLAAIFGQPDEFSSDNGLLFTGAAVGAVVGLATLGIFGILAIAYTVVIALLTGFLALIFRKVAVIILLILFPLAIAAWVLPGDDGLWKKWRTTFTSLLLMYPVLILAIASGKVFAYITSGAELQNGSLVANNADDVATWIISIAAYIGGYVAIPLIIRSFAGAFSNLTGMVNNKSKGLVDRGRNNLQGKRDQQKQWSKDRSLENARIKQAEGSRNPVNTWRTGTLGAGLGKRKATATQKNRDRTQGWKDGYKQTLEDSPLPELQAREEGVNQLETARLNLDKTKKSNETFNPDAIRANLQKGVTKENFENAAALLDQRTSSMPFMDKMKHAAQTATTSNDQSEIDAAISLLAQNKSYDGLVHVQEALAAQGSEGAAKWNAAKDRSYSDIKGVGAGLPQELSGGETAPQLRADRAKKVKELSLQDLAKEGDGSWKDLAHTDRGTATARGALIKGDDILKNVIGSKSEGVVDSASATGPLDPTKVAGHDFLNS